MNIIRKYKIDNMNIIEVYSKEYLVIGVAIFEEDLDSMCQYQDKKNMQVVE